MRAPPKGLGETSQPRARRAAGGAEGEEQVIEHRPRADGLVVKDRVHDATDQGIA